MKKNFNVEETFNKQSDKSLWTVIKGSLQTGTKDQTKLLSCLSDGLVGGVTSSHFCEKGVKTAARKIQQDILTNVVEPLNQTMFQN